MCSRPSNGTKAFIAYDGKVMLRDSDDIVVRTRGAHLQRIIPSGKWWLDRSTPVGEDAILYERKPYSGRKEIEWRNVLAILRQREESPHG